jgi:hypothetical protein
LALPPVSFYGFLATSAASSRLREPANDMVDRYHFSLIRAREMVEEAQPVPVCFRIHQARIRNDLPAFTLQVSKRHINIVAPPTKSVAMGYGSDAVHGNPRLRQIDSLPAKRGARKVPSFESGYSKRR